MLLETYTTLTGEDLASRLPKFLNIGNHGYAKINRFNLIPKNSGFFQVLK